VSNNIDGKVSGPMITQPDKSSIFSHFIQPQISFIPAGGLINHLETNRQREDLEQFKQDHHSSYLHFNSSEVNRFEKQ
jgi:hypothetical protein